MFDFHRENIIKTLTDFNIDDLAIQLSDGSVYELEAKFTSYNYEKRKISSGVPYVHYLRLIEFLDKDMNYVKKIEKSEVVLYENDIRKIVIDKINNQEIIYERKTHIKNIDIKDYNIRISLNNEKLIDIKNVQPKGITRGRIRRSYFSENFPVTIDVTEITEEIDVIQSTGITMKEISIKYEVEVEYHGLKSDIQDFFDTTH